MTTPRLEAHSVVKHYRTRRGVVRAVDGVSFTVPCGQTLGIVGESGCGKSTTARLLVRLEQPTSGVVRVDGEDISGLRGRSLRRHRRRIQLVFQDPYASLNPRLTVGDTLSEVLQVHRLSPSRTRTRQRVGELLAMVGLDPTMAPRYPHQLSGGQRQRVGIARALAVQPDILVLDEPVSALDVSVRAEILNLLTRLRDELGLTYVFISHDLATIRHFSDQVAVMYLGRLVELGGWRQVCDTPLHPYTRSLHDAVPLPDPTYETTREITPLAGEVPDPAAPPAGCRFHPRCPLAIEQCRRTEPTLDEVAPIHQVSCHLVSGDAGME